MQNLSGSENPIWSMAKKISFRFAFIYFLLFILFDNNGAYPFLTPIDEWIAQLPQTFIPWFARHILHLKEEITNFTNGSGDTTYNYLLLLAIALFAVLCTLIWSMADRRRNNYRTLYYWLTVALRYYIALTLINYGLWKILKLQFPDLGFFRLRQSYGDSSPMGLAWTFLSFSYGYNLFMGMAEIAAGLLLFRRTLTVGLIITLMTTANVMAINYFYDIPVKILSTTLVAMTLFLLLHDVGILFSFFLKGDAISLSIIKEPTFKKKWMRVAKNVLKTLLIVYAFVYGFYDAAGYRKEYIDVNEQSPLFGFYKVDHFISGRDTVRMSSPTLQKWDDFIIDYAGYANVNYEGDSVGKFYIEIDSATHKVDFSDRQDTTKSFSLRYNELANHLSFTGVIEKDTVLIQMTKKQMKEFRLMNRGFHWISEFPYNK